VAGIERFGSGGPWEAGFGYSRTVRAGDSSSSRARRGAHGERFGAHPPVCTLVQVAALIDPRMLVEIEATAYVGG